MKFELERVKVRELKEGELFAYWYDLNYDYQHDPYIVLRMRSAAKTNSNLRANETVYRVKIVDEFPELACTAEKEPMGVMIIPEEPEL